MAESLGLAAGGPTFVGSPSTVADAMERWLVEGDLDGFNILDPMPLCSYPEFVTWVVPELQRRGRVWRDYEGATLREYLHGPGRMRVLPTHPAGIVRDSHRTEVVSTASRAGGRDGQWGKTHTDDPVCPQVGIR
jgi:hypothetical protein